MLRAVGDLAQGLWLNLEQKELVVVELVKQMPLHPVEEQVSLLVLEKWKCLRECSTTFHC